VALNIVRRPKATPIHELERYMRCKDCSQIRGYGPATCDDECRFARGASEGKMIAGAIRQKNRRT